MINDHEAAFDPGVLVPAARLCCSLMSWPAVRGVSQAEIFVWKIKTKITHQADAQNSANHYIFLHISGGVEVLHGVPCVQHISC